MRAVSLSDVHLCGVSLGFVERTAGGRLGSGRIRRLYMKHDGSQSGKAAGGKQWMNWGYVLKVEQTMDGKTVTVQGQGVRGSFEACQEYS